MPIKKLNYKEGDWFAVPLREGGYAVGLAARVPRGGRIVLGYFFGPKRSEIPSLGEIESLEYKDAILVCQFGDLELFEGNWPIIGQPEGWDREKWPLPQFVRIDLISGKAMTIVYSEDELEEVDSFPCGAKDVNKYPEDGMSGAGAVEIVLTEYLK
jgi:hypothetical protein